MKKFILTTKKKMHSVASSAMLLFISTSNALAAGIPKMEAPSKGEGSGFFETIKNYIFDFITLVVLGLCAWGLIKVAYAAIETYGEVRNKKASWGEFGGIILVGVILIVAVIWLGTKAIDIFA